VTKTSGSAAVTAAAGTFNEEDAGRPISGTGIPASTTLASVTSDTAATLSANATATGAGAATIGATNEASAGSYGFIGWSPETDAESETYSVAANNASTTPPDRITNTYTGVSQRSRG
jgi:hypothetical protein